MLKKTVISRGSIYISFYVIICAISHVFVNHTTRSIEPTFTLFYSSILTIIFFLVLNLGELTKNIVIIKKIKNQFYG